MATCAPGRETELKSLSGAVAADGGYAVPREIDALIARELTEISPIRSIAQVVQTGTAGYRKLVTTGGTASGWVSETAGRPETDDAAASPRSPRLRASSTPTRRRARRCSTTRRSTSKAGWRARSRWNSPAPKAPRSSTAAGSTSPRASSTAPISALGDGGRAFGTLQYIGTGDAAGFGASPEGKLIDLVHALKAGHRQGASWVMNSATLAKCASSRPPTARSCGSRAWSRASPTGCSATRWSRPRTCPMSPRDAFPIAFGNFRAGYLIAERSATSILRDPFTHKPFVHFYATKRIGGQVLDSAAIKLLRIEA